jgi:hypothetical protein
MAPLLFFLAFAFSVAAAAKAAHSECTAGKQGILCAR